MDPFYNMPSSNMFRPACAEDWEPYRETITEIYSQNTLAYTMDEMKAVYNFSATAKQYKNKIKEWGLDNKYVKDYEYERLLQLPAQTEYTVRDKVVTHQDLARYRRRKEKNPRKHTQSDNTSGSNAGEGSSSGAGDSYASQYVVYSGAEDATQYATQYTTAGGGMADYGSGYVYDPTGVLQEGDFVEADPQPYPDDYDASGTMWNF